MSVRSKKTQSPKTLSSADLDTNKERFFPSGKKLELRVENDDRQKLIRKHKK